MKIRGLYPRYTDVSAVFTSKSLFQFKYLDKIFSMWPGVRKTAMKMEEKAGRPEERSEEEVGEEKDEDEMVRRSREFSPSCYWFSLHSW